MWKAFNYIILNVSFFTGCVQTLSNSTPPKGKIHTFRKIATTYKPMMQFGYAKVLLTHAFKWQIQLNCHDELSSLTLVSLSSILINNENQIFQNVLPVAQSCSCYQMIPWMYTTPKITYFS